MEEAREKIELFRTYYLVCFRSFDQDQYSPTYLEPLNMYIIVFREGTLSVGCLLVMAAHRVFIVLCRHSIVFADFIFSSISGQHPTHRMSGVESNTSRTISV